MPSPARKTGQDEAGSPRTAIYPGTFDPITNGHLSVIRRALTVFDSVIVAVAENAGKNPLFSLDRRVAFVREALADLGDRVQVRPYGNLTVDFGREYGACAIVRGLRATGDFEYEFQLALMNRRLNRTIQSVFLMTDYQWLYVSSSIIKAAASHGGSIDGLVPDFVRDSLVELYTQGRMHHSTPCLGAPLQGFPRTEQSRDSRS
ncbi:MAG: pantetheine-phosphate adenylyltransferase [Desulfovibrionaceae bacterium]|nr:pantetheine-phosphate adenylyltransferase [Desulfovibrionaceae bacterium]